MDTKPREGQPSVAVAYLAEHSCNRATNAEGDLLDRAARFVGYRNARRYEHRGRFLFEGINLSGARVLDVGCGSGAWAIWAVLHGASKAMGIEPEADGSTGGTFDSFRESIKRLGLDQQIEARAVTLQDLPRDVRFDVAVLYNVINHLDEAAVVSLHANSEMMQRYLKILAGLRARISTGGFVIVADCARSNLWPTLGMRAPFARSIEWQKHQNPALWRHLFENAGFETSGCRWSPLYPLGKLTTNRFVHYITVSHFVLTLRAV